MPTDTPLPPASAASAGLLPCPFCGEQPESFPSGMKDDGLMIECVNQACGVQAHVSYIPPSAAIAAWNRRTARAPQGDAGEVAEEAANSILSTWAYNGFVPSPPGYRDLHELISAAIAAALTSREQAARAEERKRCAKVAEDFRLEREVVWIQQGDWARGAADAINGIAAAIRAPAGDGK